MKRLRCWSKTGNFCDIYNAMPILWGPFAVVRWLECIFCSIGLLDASPRRQQHYYYDHRHNHWTPQATARPILISSSRPFSSRHNERFDEDTQRGRHHTLPDGPLVDFSDGSIPNGPLIGEQELESIILFSWWISFGQHMLISKFCVTQKCFIQLYSLLCGPSFLHNEIKFVDLCDSQNFSINLI